MFNGRSNKSLSRSLGQHVLYDHRQRPTDIDVRCPACQALARAHEPCEFPCTVHGDLSPQWKKGGSFTVKCMKCSYRAEPVRYVDLGEPYHQITIGRTTLWAWNRQHLLTLRAYLAGQSVERKPYAGFMSYVRRAWLARREEFVRAIDKYLARRTR